MAVEEVYFKNENDAEAAKASLSKVDAHNITVEELPSGFGSRGGFIPLFAASGYGRTGMGVPFVGDDSSDDAKAEKADPKHLSHLLRFEVGEQDREEAIALLKDHNPYGLEKK